MTAPLHLDTHVVIWLFADQRHLVAGPVLDRLETDDLRISPMVRLELTYLHEVGRIAVPAARILDELERSIGLTDDTTPFALVTRTAAEQRWTRDPFDRVIAAQALAGFGVLATKDAMIREALRGYALWG
ncbi:type II toxin-antitoxin system VapC family toxin [Nocardioides caeni]|uniref:Type II toxin-antitoxin system VapC family toxin n=1 Tax=Nocardioides caeni TaxID=574700 RepID=A0A4S8NGX4_9ACTN|nr:PIN domain-containing protein [Nocardioides caeni]THV16043.1 type II toxin-antitoxin system VapC family toxin [Nocardioides caeni]